MKVEIWSDIMCPFCYIGKRRFEKALHQFPHQEDIEITWKSFQLNPDMKTEPGKNINQYLAEHKGWTLEQAREANNYVTQMAKEEGLEYNMDKAVVANSLDAHRLIQFAKTLGKGDAMEEELFRAYFTGGKNTADHAVLIESGTAIGLDSDAIKNMLAGDDFTEAVEQDIYEARQIGLRGVPYFVLNDKYAVSGAQAAETFAGALNRAWEEWQLEKPAITQLSGNSGDSCSIDGDC